MLRVRCQSCFHAYGVKDEHAGGQFRCRECGATVVVPADEIDEEPPAILPPRQLPRRETADRPRHSRSMSETISAWGRNHAVPVGIVVATVVAVLIVLRQEGIDLLFALQATGLAVLGIGPMFWAAWLMSRHPDGPDVVIIGGPLFPLQVLLHLDKTWPAVIAQGLALWLFFELRL